MGRGCEQEVEDYMRDVWDDVQKDSSHVELCYKKIGITIPDNYVSTGKNPQKTFDIGTINLANKFTGETTDCIN
ncbi:Transthyretin-like family protein [Oesophagostomum dentatum]|uniref:Transthyretin-like family protein n=1 Tax=Oesophagostomum dentatum TaxID=61180 RepID=A0A0B1TEC1_OESDE|nr:Transthyretin-like family protein [Oesophagostomum dentatum]